MGGRALVAGFGAAAQVFLLAVLTAGVAVAVKVPAEARPADHASTAPNAVEPAESPPSEADQAPAEAASPVGEDETPASPAAAGASEEGRDPADAVDTDAEPASEADRRPADTAAVAPDETQPQPAGTTAPPPKESEQQPAATTPSDGTPVPTPAAEPVPAHPIVAEIRLKLQDPALRKGAAADDLAALEAYYAEHVGPPLWITTVGFSARAGTLIAEIQKAGDWGLAPEAFDLPPPPTCRPPPRPKPSTRSSLRSPF